MDKYQPNFELFWALAAVVGAAVLFQLLATYYHNGLNRYPGPLLAKFTRLWYRLDVKANRHQQHLIELHRKYGDVVRIGPNSLSVSNADEMYDPFAPRVNGKRLDSSLSVRDPKAHAAMHKPIAKAYSMTTLTDYEPLVDQMITKLLEQLREKNVGENKICDIGLWMRLYAFDVILQVTLSDTLGFMDKGDDIEDFFKFLDMNIDRSSLLVTMPWTAYLLKHNPIVSYFSKDSSMFPGWTALRLQNRLKDRAENNPTGSRYAPRDFLDRFVDAAHTERNPDFDFTQALNWTLTNVVAGGDTTTIALKAVMYYLLKNPAKKRRLIEDLEAAKLSIPVSWVKSQQIPYLDAVIKESLRIHPPIGLGLERTASGFEMPDGYILPPGTNVGMNSWVVNRQPVFGENVDDFVPERWLRAPTETEDQHKDRLNNMRRADLVFGAGARSCTGKHVSYLEMHKVIPSFLLTFDMEIVDEKDEWTLVNGWTTRQDNIRCFLRDRGS
ncbi:hypothetical protein G7Y89_g13018 [Cudoniella acicularis]|uniref:Cytochrome P450 n=1 Tax=Cudoniella acicularis TaxID=354080 RepID=A0A8H4VWG6_9HELO|nr:hypothetical protein G7Y89_g13018 [Cudoniella acicularis]